MPTQLTNKQYLALVINRDIVEEQIEEINVQLKALRDQLDSLLDGDDDAFETLRDAENAVAAAAVAAAKIIVA